MAHTEEQYTDDRQGTSAALVESLQEQYKNDIAQLHGVYTALLTTQSKDPSHDTHRDDTENVYILIKYHGKDRLINIGKRDELDETYLSKSPIPLLITERNAAEQTRMIRIDSTDTHIHIRNYQHALAMGRGALLYKKFSHSTYQDAVKDIKRLQRLDKQQFYKQMRKGRKFYSEERGILMDCLTQMGISSTKLQTGDEEAYNDLYALIQTFDTKKQLFTVQEERRKRKDGGKWRKMEEEKKEERRKRKEEKWRERGNLISLI